MFPERFKDVISRFRIEFLGIGLIHAWLQIVFYNNYRQADGDYFSIVMNLTRVTTMIIIAIIALSLCKRFLNLPRFSVFSACLMIVASLGMGANELLHIPYLSHACGILGAIGVAWGGGMWVTVYTKLSLVEALFYTCLSISFGSIVGSTFNLVPLSISLLLSSTLPLVALLWCKKSLALVEDRAIPSEPVYDDVPWTSFIPPFLSFAVFGFALGISRAFPDTYAGAAMDNFTILEQFIHRFGVVALSLFIIWWVFINEKNLHFRTLWGALVAVVSTGVFVLSAQESFSNIALTLTTLANTMALPILWFTLTDISRNTTRSSVFIFGLGWSTYMFSRNLGRICGNLLLNSDFNAISLITLITYLSSMSLIFVLGDRIGGVRPLFRGLASQNADGSSAQPHDVTHESKTTPTVENVMSRYGLSPRETEVARYIAQGRSKAAIAELMGLSENTVRAYGKTLYKKLDIHSKQELIDMLHQDEPLNKPGSDH